MRHSSFAGSDSRRINASPRLSTRAVAATNGCEASRSTLPVLSQPPYTRSASPNVTKRTGWTTPRTSADATAEVDLPAAAEDNDAHEEDETADGTNFGNVDEYAETAIKTIQAKSFAGTVTVDLDVIPMENAVEILEAIAQENESRRQTAQQRTRLLERAESQRINEVNEHEPQQLAYLEHMYSTVQLLHSNLEKERTRTGSCKVSSSVSNNSGDTLAHQAMLSDLGSRPHVAMPVKSPKRVDVSTKLLQSPLRIRLSNAPANAPTATFPAHTNAQSELQSLLHHNADLRIRNKAIQRHGLAEKDLEASTDEVAGDKLISSREQKLRDTLNEKVYWQHEYECMRDQVVEEKSHQVELFRRLESAKRHHFQRTDELERALRECHVEIELLRAQLTETQVRVVQQRKRMEEQAKHTKEEKEKLVCSIAETRHKFKDWKEGEVGTLKAARDQAVHNLKTEYELKIARHHEEKQKLRDKVKDLEVSLRLLQRDRNLSAVELSLRKATILGSKEASTTTEAELIEANSRIKELEALLNHTKEYQKRQEHIIKVSESTIARLMQEWEVVALENLTLQPMAALTLPKVSDPTDSTHLNRFSVSLHSGALAVPTVGISIPHAKASVEMDDNANPRSSSFGVHHHVARENVESPPSKGRASQKVGSSADMVLHPLSTMASTMRTSSDPEKEILRRQSIVLSAEVEKYRQIVVHSLDEIRTLKDSKRRSHHGMLVGGPNGNATNLKEQYLFSEVLKLQAELDAMKEMQKKHAKKKKKKHPDTINKFGGEPKEASESDNDLGSSSSSSSSESSSSDRDDDDSKSDGDAEQDEEHAIDDISRLQSMRTTLTLEAPQIPRQKSHS
uniref:Uncharacterized protein n=1 Tax=Globisporangium ultimum (strain ATCC 200006 / CBS 805.95 / DAOM BR144) TaxID=431595 RepID=K3W4W0_GLOUD